MKANKIINQLESIAENSKSFIDCNSEDSIWNDDIKAINAAIRIIKKNKRADEQFWKGVALGALVVLLLCLLNAIKSM